MNPYLRLPQPVRGSNAYLYAQLILEGEWPEIPESATAPEVYIDIKNEMPLGSVEAPQALVDLNVYLGKELLGSGMYERTLIGTQDHGFVYDSPSFAGPSLEPPAVLVPAPGQEAFYDLVQQVEELNNDIELQMDSEAEAWQPPAPVPPNQSEYILNNLYQAMKKQPPSIAFPLPMPNIGSANPAPVGIAYAVWREPFPGKKSPFILYAVVPLQEIEDQFEFVLFDAEEAVAKAYALMHDLGWQFPNDWGMDAIEPVVQRLEDRARGLLSEQRRQKSQPSAPPPAPWKSAWDE